MAKPTKDPFKALNATELAIVNGGRLIANKGPDPAVIQGIQLLVKTLAEVGQQMQQGSQAQSQQMMQMMQQLMERRKAGG